MSHGTTAQETFPKTDAAGIDKKRQRMADRIAGRAHYTFRQGAFSTVVRGGRFGGETMPDPEIYESVAARLLNTVDEIEIKVHRIHRTQAPVAPFQGYDMLDVISVATLGGFPKYLMRNPVTDPGKFVSDEFGDMTATQIYPPLEEAAE